ncbi:MAG: TraR/DksA family transcriptional regulator [Acidimicrobiales bacterium]
MDHQRARELLGAERLRVEELLEHLSADGNAERLSAAAQGDLTDAGESIIAEQEGEATTASLRNRLAAIERAQARLDDGTYGHSLRSGRAIPDERLEADPAAELTVDEAEEG